MSTWLIDTLLYTGALIGVVLVLRRPVGRYFGPQFAYALWALPFLRLLLPPIVLPARFAPAPATAPVSAHSEPLASLQTDRWTSVASERGELIAPVLASSPPAADSTHWVAIAVSLWAGVALAFLAWRVVTYRRMRRELLRGSRPVGEIGRIRLVETPAIAAPVAFGVIDKVIALPPLFMAQHDIVARDLAIEHEFAHHKGHDLLANFAAQALLALHWFNPLAWYGWRAMRRDQEAACDARVLAGKGREERLRYAALIAGIATGPRPLLISGALAAPMACPILGERSIVHRLRSLSMAEVSRRRRWLGRAMIGASALALPLTASVSYAASSAQPAPPAPPAPPAAELPPAPPAAPRPGEVGPQQDASSFALAGDGEAATKSAAREFTVRRGEGTPVPAMPKLEFDGGSDPSDPAFQARMETFEREMEQWSREMQDWGEQFGERYASQARAKALAWAEAARGAPEVVESCDENEQRRTATVDGRSRVVICEREIEARANAGAIAGLRGARATIAHNRQIGEDVQREILADLDDEIERLEREVH